MKPALVIHPFLFGLFPLVIILRTNIAEVQPIDAIPVIAISLSAVGVVGAVAWIVSRDLLRAGMIASGFIIFLYTPFHATVALRAWLTDIYQPAALFSDHLVLLAFIAGIVFWIYFFGKRAQGLRQINSIMNVVSVCLVGFSGWNLAAAKLAENFDWLGIQSKLQAESLVPNLPSTVPLPDIYFIVMDRYAGAQTLKSIYGFDNREFLEKLEARGFYVAGNSAANYPSTAQSMASSLNLQYINFFKDLVGPKSDSLAPLHNVVQNHRVRQFLASVSYRYIHLGSWWAQPAETVSPIRTSPSLRCRKCFIS